MRSWTTAAVMSLSMLAPIGAIAAEKRTEPARHVIYLHGRIVQEEQSPRPRHPRYGTYELEEILRTFRDRGFVVTGEIRPKGESVSAAADSVVAQVRALLASGVPGDHVTVVGGSMGAAIALRASARLGRADVRFAFLGACLRDSLEEVATEEGKRPAGHILSVRESSDDTSPPCTPWRADPAERGLVAREIVVSTGLGHGFLYRPLPVWVDPVVAWVEGT